MRLLIPTILNPSGISKSTREVYKLIKHLRIKVSTILTLGEELDLLEKDIIDQMICDQIPYDEEIIQLHIGPPNNMSIVKYASVVIGLFVMEGQKLSPMQMEPCRNVKSIAVPSRFCFKACISSGLPKNKVFYVPYPLDTKMWNKDVKPFFLSDDNVFRFLYMNSIYERKGLDLLLRAFCLEFKKYEKVQLVIKSYRENDRPESAFKFVSKILDDNSIDINSSPSISILDFPIKDEEIPGFMKSFDAFVSPHRSEGFGMNPWYAMSLGVPVICTDWGGVTDFANEDTAWMVSYDKLVSPSNKEKEIFGHLNGIVWAEPSIDSLRFQLRKCYKEEKERNNKAINGANFVEQNFKFDVVGEKFLNFLESSDINLRDIRDIRDIICNNNCIFDEVIFQRRIGNNSIKMVEI